MHTRRRAVKLDAMIESIPIGWLLTPAATSLPTILDHASLLEDQGFEHLWLGEAWREVTVPLAALAASTSKIALGSGIMQIYPINPVIAAQQAAQIAELSGRSFTLGLGLGAGFVIERWFGVSYERPLRRMREFLEVVDGVLKAPENGPFSYEGEIFRLRGYSLPFAQRTPDVWIYIAAVGPKMQQLAGELADGIVVGGVHSEQYMDSVRRNLEIGAERTGRDPATVDIVYLVPCAVWPESDRARTLAQGALAYTTQYAHYMRIWRNEGYRQVTEKVAQHVRAHEMDRALALITDEMVERYAVFGPPKQCYSQLERYRNYPGRPLLILTPFRMSDEDVMASLRLGAEQLPTYL